MKIYIEEETSTLTVPLGEKIARISPSGVKDVNKGFNFSLAMADPETKELVEGKYFRKRKSRRGSGRAAGFKTRMEAVPGPGFKKNFFSFKL